MGGLGLRSWATQLSDSMHLDGCVVRVSADFEITHDHELSTSHQDSLSDLWAENPQLHAVLIPKRPGLSVKAVSSATVGFLTKIGASVDFPSAAAVELLPGREQDIARLVLDRILEIGPPGGPYKSGVSAYSLLIDATPLIGPTGRIARLSLESLQYADAIRLTDPKLIAVRLYRYNTVPASPSIHRRFATTEAVARYLDVTSPTTAGVTPNIQPGLARYGKPWLTWTRKQTTASATSYKLYVSPTLDYVRPALCETLRLFANWEPVSCKVGRDLGGLLRPDKLVVYFTSYAELTEAAADLAAALDGVPAQGVPFTAELAGDGLLSWGIDPPRRHQLLGWRGGEPSWRGWLTNRLALAILSAHESEEAPEAPRPWEYALARVALDGVNIERWTPDREWEN